MGWIKRTTSFLSAFAWTICSSNNGVKSSGDGQHSPKCSGLLPAVYDQYADDNTLDIWHTAFDDVVVYNIDSRFHKDAKIMMETQHRYLHKNFQVSNEDNQMLAVVYAYLISKLIIWDICGVQAFSRPISEVRVSATNPRGGHIPDYPVIACTDFQLHCSIRHDLFTSWSQHEVDVFTDEVASELNNHVIDVMFGKTGRPKTFKYGGSNPVNTPAELMVEYEKESHKIGEQITHSTANWLLVTEDIKDLILDQLDIQSLRDVESLDRANIIVYNIKVSGMQLMVFNNIHRTGESYIGFTDATSNDHAPIIFAPHVLMKLEGPIGMSRYLVNSCFGCVEHSLRKKMIKKINIINEDKNEV